MAFTIISLLVFHTTPLLSGQESESVRWQGILYQDYLGFKDSLSDYYQQLGSRLKLDIEGLPWEGWAAKFDFRFTKRFFGIDQERFRVYDACISYDKKQSRLYLNLGRMNLYDKAGIGQITGGLLGIKLNKTFSLGGYWGLKPDIYNYQEDIKRQQLGFFALFRGDEARQFSLSYNQIRLNNSVERQFLYANALLPFRGLVILYSSVEYELKSNIKSSDRLSRVFNNLRINLSDNIHLTANYSSGRGLDFQQFLLENDQNPSLQNNEIERYYYNESYGIRINYKPLKNFRLYYGLRRSTQIDKDIINKTNRWGLSLIHLTRLNLSLVMNYTYNDGDRSESDSYYFSISKNFNRFSVTISAANYYNAIRYTGESIPQLIHLPDQKTLTFDIFFYACKSFSLSGEYSYSFSNDFKDHQFFIRAIFRKRR